MEKISEYVGIASDEELLDLISFGYDIVYQDVNLSVIYDEMRNAFTNAQIEDHLGYYGPGLLLQVDGIYYWLMQK